MLRRSHTSRLSVLQYSSTLYHICESNKQPITEETTLVLKGELKYALIHNVLGSVVICVSLIALLPQKERSMMLKETSCNLKSWS